MQQIPNIRHFKKWLILFKSFKMYFYDFINPATNNFFVDRLKNWFEPIHIN